MNEQQLVSKYLGEYKVKGSEIQIKYCPFCDGGQHHDQAVRRRLDGREIADRPAAAGPILGPNPAAVIIYYLAADCQSQPCTARAGSRGARLDEFVENRLQFAFWNAEAAVQYRNRHFPVAPLQIQLDHAPLR